MNIPSARMAAGGRKKAVLPAPTTVQQPSTSSGAAPLPAGTSEEDDDWGKSLSRPSFACDDRALGEMRTAVGSILESVGFTHAANSALELLTDIGIRYMRKLANTATNTSEMDGRTRPTDADVIAVYRAMHVDIDEMREYLRQVRPVAEPRLVPAFPLPIAPTPIVCTAVPPSLLIPPPEHAFPGLPPMSTQWLRPEDLAQIIPNKDKEIDVREEGRREEKTLGVEEVKRMISSFSGADSLPSFFSKSATAFGLRKSDREVGERREVRDVRMEVQQEEEFRKEGKRKNTEKGGRSSKQSRPAAAATAPATVATPSLQQEDEPGTSSGLYKALQQSSRPPSRAPTPAVAAALPSGPISALRDATRPVLASSANVPLAGALAPECANAYTEGTPLRLPGLLAAIGREGSENREVEKQCPTPSPLARPSTPPLTEADLRASPPANAPPTKLVQMAILRSLFLKDHSLEEQLARTLHSFKSTATATSSYATAAAKAASRTSTPLPPLPREPKEQQQQPIAPRVTIKPPVKPSSPTVPVVAAPSPVIGTPLPPLRLKINIGRRPSVDTAPPTPASAAAAGGLLETFDAFMENDGASTAGPSSASTIPLLFSPATAAAAAAAEAASEQPENEEDDEGKKKKKKHKKEKKEKKEKKHKKHKKDSKRDEEDEEEAESRSQSRSSARDNTVDAPSPAPPSGGLKLKIRLGPRPTE